MLLTGSASGVQTVCAFVALAFNARALGPEDFGVLAMIQGYAAMVSSLATFESWQPMIRLGVISRRRLGHTLGCGAFLDLAAASAATAVAILGILLFGPILGIAEGYQHLAIIYSLSLLGGVGGTPKGYFRLAGRFSVLAGNQISQGLALLTSAAILWALDASLLVYVVVLAAIAAIYNLTLFLRMLADLRRAEINLANPLRSPTARNYLRQVFSMATGTSLLSTLLNARRNIPLFLVGALVGSNAAGAFAVGAKLANFATRLSGPINQVLFPLVIRANRPADGGRPFHWIGAASIAAGFAAVCLASVAFFFRNWVVSVAAGPGFSSAGLVFSLLFAAECIGLAGLHINASIQSIRGTRPLIIIGLLSLLPLVPVAVVLSPNLGAIGIAVACLLSAALTYVGMMVTVLWLLRNKSHDA